MKGSEAVEAIIDLQDVIAKNMVDIIDVVQRNFNAVKKDGALIFEDNQKDDLVDVAKDIRERTQYLEANTLYNRFLVKAKMRLSGVQGQDLAQEILEKIFNVSKGYRKACFELKKSDGSLSAINKFIEISDRCVEDSKALLFKSQALLEGYIGSHANIKNSIAFFRQSNNFAKISSNNSVKKTWMPRLY